MLHFSQTMYYNDLNIQLIIYKQLKSFKVIFLNICLKNNYTEYKRNKFRKIKISILMFPSFSFLFFLANYVENIMQ